MAFICMLIRPMAGCQLLCLHVGSTAPAGKNLFVISQMSFMAPLSGPGETTFICRWGQAIELKKKNSRLNCKCTKWTQRTGLLRCAHFRPKMAHPVRCRWQRINRICSDTHSLGESETKLDWMRFEAIATYLGSAPIENGNLNRGAWRHKTRCRGRRSHSPFHSAPPADRRYLTCLWWAHRWLKVWRTFHRPRCHKTITADCRPKSVLRLVA